MPSMLMATLQGAVSCLLLYAALAAPVAGYALARYGSGEMAWFTAVAFFLMSLYVTQVCITMLGICEQLLLACCGGISTPPPDTFCKTHPPAAADDGVPGHLPQGQRLEGRFACTQLYIRFSSTQTHPRSRSC